MGAALFDLTGRVAVVTGGNGGIGKAIAAGYLDAGARVAIAARNDAKTDAAVTELAGAAAGEDVRGYHSDVSQADDIARLVEQVLVDFGAIDILVNNAGIAAPAPVAVLQDAQWEQVLATNLTGTFRLAQAVGRHMLQRKEGGKIINVASEYAQFGGAMVAAYAASKGGVMQFTKSLAVEWASQRICVNALVPGWIETDMTAPMTNSGLGKHIIKRTPMGRWGVPDDIIGAAVFLAAPASDFITGQAIVVDGGFNVMA